MRQRTIIYFATAFVALLLTGYVYIYQTSPLPENWNDILLYAADPFATLLAAMGVTAVLLCYQRDDKPYVVWLYFTIGMWVWLIAETLYAYLGFSSGETPPSGLADVLWFIGYGMLSVALYYQYRLLHNPKNGWLKLILIWVGVVLLTPLILFVLQVEINPENILAYLYPVVDFAICIVALRLYMSFGSGKLSRPWMGLFVMGIADALWAWLAAGGADQSDFLSLLSDTTYVAAYLVLAVGFFRQYLLLHFGPE